MRSFGISVGIAGLAKLLRFALPEHLWLAETAAVFALVALLASVVFVLCDSGLGGFVERLLFKEDACYLGWSAVTLVILSSFQSFAPVQDVMWTLGHSLGVFFALLGLRDLWRSARSIDPAHMGWFAWMLPAGLTAPSSLMTLQAPGFAFKLQVVGVLVTFALTLACWVRVLMHRSFQGARSPWFVLGGMSAVAFWTLTVLQPSQPSLASPLLWAAFALAVGWTVPLAQLVVLTGQRSAWPNLYPLTSLTLLAATLQLHLATALLGVFASYIAAVELRNLLLATTKASASRLQSWSRANLSAAAQDE